MLDLPDSWVWDFWIVDDGLDFHVFFLFASKALQLESRRHRRASIGHAISSDLVHWTRLPDALVRSEAPAFDDVATWTGSCVRGDDGTWYLFYTGISDDPIPAVQRISTAVSRDLVSWTKVGHPLVVADPRWYLTAADGDEPWRDPWVFRDEGGLWHMLTTASDHTHPDPLSRGVVGHAVSTDLLEWKVRPPLTRPGHGFGQLEVPQIIESDQTWWLVFSCLGTELAPGRRKLGGGGTWIAPGSSRLGPFDLESARLITDPSRYAGRPVRDRDGSWKLLAFRNLEHGEFVGILADPVEFRPTASA